MHEHEREREVEHDEECAEQVRYSGACRHGHAFQGGCDRQDCPFSEG